MGRMPLRINCEDDITIRRPTQKDHLPGKKTLASQFVTKLGPAQPKLVSFLFKQLQCLLSNYKLSAAMKQNTTQLAVIGQQACLGAYFISKLNIS